MNREIERQRDIQGEREKRKTGNTYIYIEHASSKSEKLRKYRDTDYSRDLKKYRKREELDSAKKQT